MRMSLRLGNRAFAPGLWPTLAALFFFVLTLWLGNWQSERAETKRALQARRDAALAGAPIRLGAAPGTREALLHRRVEAEGRFDAAHTILLDNRVRRGVAGYHVLTPLRIDGGPPAVLVNRGWIAAGRSRLQPPEPPTPAGRVRIEGLAVEPQTRYVELAPTEPRGPVWQNLDFERYAATSGLPLQPVLLLLTSDVGDGLERDWPRPDAGVDTHRGYAIQWYGLAATVAVLWVVLNLERHPGRGGEAGR